MRGVQTKHYQILPHSGHEEQEYVVVLHTDSLFLPDDSLNLTIVNRLKYLHADVYLVGPTRPEEDKLTSDQKRLLGIAHEFYENKIRRSPTATPTRKHQQRNSNEFRENTSPKPAIETNICHKLNRSGSEHAPRVAIVAPKPFKGHLEETLNTNGIVTISSREIPVATWQEGPVIREFNKKERTLGNPHYTTSNGKITLQYEKFPYKHHQHVDSSTCAIILHIDQLFDQDNPKELNHRFLTTLSELDSPIYLIGSKYKEIPAEAWKALPIHSFLYSNDEDTLLEAMKTLAMENAQHSEDPLNIIFFGPLDQETKFNALISSSTEDDIRRSTIIGLSESPRTNILLEQLNPLENNALKGSIKTHGLQDKFSYKPIVKKYVAELNQYSKERGNKQKLLATLNAIFKTPISDAEFQAILAENAQKRQEKEAKLAVFKAMYAIIRGMDTRYFLYFRLFGDIDPLAKLNQLSIDDQYQAMEAIDLNSSKTHVYFKFAKQWADNYNKDDANEQFLTITTEARNAFKNTDTTAIALPVSSPAEPNDPRQHDDHSLRNTDDSKLALLKALLAAYYHANGKSIKSSTFMNNLNDAGDASAQITAIQTRADKLEIYKKACDLMTKFCDQTLTYSSEDLLKHIKGEYPNAFKPSLFRGSLEKQIRGDIDVYFQEYGYKLDQPTTLVLQ